jgi:hypothetical protein
MSTLKKELQEIAKTIGVENYGKLKKAELIAAIEVKKAPAAAVEKKEEVAPAPTAAPANARKQNAWNDHVRSYRAEHGCSYREAMSKARATYVQA